MNTRALSSVNSHVAPAALVALALAAALSLAAPAVAADDAPAQAPLRLTLDEAIARARDAAPALRRIEALAAAARASEDAVEAARRPGVTLSASATRQSDVDELALEMPGMPPRVIFPNLPDRYRTRAEVSQALLTGGRLPAQRDAARAEGRALAEDRDAQDAALVLEVEEAYWSLVTARALESVLEESLRAYDAHLVDARNRERLGLAARSDVLDVEVERDRAELSLIEARAHGELAEADLVRLLDLALGTRVEAADPLAAVDAPLAPLDALVAEALAARPERAAIGERIAAAEARARAQDASSRPQLVATAGYDFANPQTRELPLADSWKGGWDATLALSWSVFDSGRADAEAAAERQRALALAHERDALDRAVRLEVTARRIDVATALASIPVAERALVAARESLRVASERHRAGVITSSERLDAEVSLLRAGLDRTDVLARARVASARLDRAVGR